ncbi:MAG: GIY-YIG nuclease family protein [bacterium]|nr:GIY-YIG nuclease family protein [bacterium]
MWYVYILKDRNGAIYIGSTNDLKRRLKEHQAGNCYSTKRLNEMNLEAYIAVNSERTARNLEKYLKTGSGKAILKKRILADEVLT